MATDNGAVVRRFFDEAWNRGNLKVIDELCAEGHRLNDASGRDTGAGRDHNKHVVASFREAFPDGSITIDDQITAGNKVTTRWTARGTHRGPLLGHPPTGKHVEVKGMQIDEFDGGKVVTTWLHWDAAGLMEQIGLGGK